MGARAPVRVVLIPAVPAQLQNPGSHLTPSPPHLCFAENGDFSHPKISTRGKGVWGGGMAAMLTFWF